MSNDELILETKGVSMIPLLLESSLVKVKLTEPCKLRAGEIILFERGDISVTHRLMFQIKLKGKRYFIEKGDNSFFFYTTEDKILGKVIAVRRQNEKDFFSITTGKWKVLNTIILMNTLLLWGSFFLVKYMPVLLFYSFFNNLNFRISANKVVQNELRKNEVDSIYKLKVVQEDFYINKILKQINQLLLKYVKKL